jgi:hypothetical protein
MLAILNLTKLVFPVVLGNFSYEMLEFRVFSRSIYSRAVTNNDCYRRHAVCPYGRMGQLGYHGANFCEIL